MPQNYDITLVLPEFTDKYAPDADNQKGEFLRDLEFLIFAVTRDYIFPPDAMERFWARVNKNGPIIKEELGPCWIHNGTRTRTGYGVCWLQGKPCLAHRFMWQFENGLIDGKIIICHKCDNTNCCRIEHLFAGSSADNMYDMWGKGRGTHGEKHYNTKLSNDDVVAIFQRANVGTRGMQAFLAREYGVDQVTISAIANGWLWRKVLQKYGMPVKFENYKDRKRTKGYHQ